MFHSLAAYSVGALLYCPAGLHDSIVNTLLHNAIPAPFSLAFCLEDTVNDAHLAEAEDALLRTLEQIQRLHAEHSFYLPRIFVRIRSPLHLRRMAARLSGVSQVLTGFILPKFYTDNSQSYLAAMEDISQSAEFSYMPIFESHAMAAPAGRLEQLAQLKEELEPVSDRILNLRVGGNDLSHVFGLRRGVSDTIYDLQPVARILLDVVSTFAADYVISGPVWEYYAGPGWDTGLERELRLDALNGFIGKTVIHPNQIPIVNRALQVTARDYADARSILSWDLDNAPMVARSVDAARMNEFKTHANWASKILALAQIYGVRPEDAPPVRRTAAVTPVVSRRAAHH